MPTLGSSMRRVAVFGNAGAGKSTLARRLANATRLPLYSLDLIQYRRGGAKISEEDFAIEHAALMDRQEWIVDGFGNIATAWTRFEAADTLIYVDLALPRHYWWVTKRLIKSAIIDPEGWPDESPMWRSTVNSYKVVGRCHRLLTPRYRQLVAEMAASKRVHHLTSKIAMRYFIEAIESEYARSS